MKPTIKLLMIAAVFFGSVLSLHAAPLKVHLAEFKVTGAPNRDELRVSLQALLASRLEGGDLQIVEAAEGADLEVVGTYIVFGKVFSLDGRVSTPSGKVVARAFEQGESADDIIPAVGRMAKKLSGEIARINLELSNAAAAAPVKGAEPVRPAAPPELIRAQAKAPEGDIVRVERAQKGAGSGMISQRLDGVMIGIARVGMPGKEEREVVVATRNELRLYLQGRELKLLETEKGFDETEKIISIDSADLDGDGIVEIYVSCFRGEELSSRVYLLESGKFRKIAADLPYFFRAADVRGGAKKLLAQQMGREEDYYGDLYEVAKKGDSFTIVNPLKLPRFANIHNTNMISHKDGGFLFVVLHPDGYLLVYDQKGENLWRGSDKFGGSETFFSRDDSQNMRVTGSQYRKRFIEQRLTVTKSGEIIVPKNEGFFVLGDSRSFTKSSLYSFAWNGAALDELWHTRLSQNYLSDYAYDAERKELVLLEVVKKEGVSEKGASAIGIKKIE